LTGGYAPRNGVGTLEAHSTHDASTGSLTDGPRVHSQPTAQVKTPLIASQLAAQVPTVPVADGAAKDRPPATKLGSKEMPKAAGANAGSKPVSATTPNPSSAPLRISVTAEVSQPTAVGLLILSGQVRIGHRTYTCRALVDSGATTEFVDTRFVKRIGVKPDPIKRPLSVSLADRSTQLTTHVVPALRVQLAGYNDHLRCYQADLGGQWDIILGRSWLKRIAPTIDWRADTVSFTFQGQTHTIKGYPDAPPDPTCGGLCISALQFKRLLRKGVPTFLCVLNDVLHNPEPCSAGDTTVQQRDAAAPVVNQAALKLKRELVWPLVEKLREAVHA
jgi:hypothetical protein